MVEKLIEIIRSEWGKTIFMACQRAFAEHLIAKDVVPVVRCEQCRYYNDTEKRCDHPCLDFDVECYDHWLDMESGDFCSYGEKREV